MKIHLPDEIKHYEPELRFFFDNMVRKLHINRHKGFGDKTGVSGLRKELKAEVRELEKALDNEKQFDVFMEAVDVSNQSWLLALAVLRLTKEDFEDGRQTVKKTKAIGSRTKVDSGPDDPETERS